MTDLPSLRRVATDRRFRGLRVGFFGFVMEPVAFVVFACGLVSLGVTLAIAGFFVGVTGMILHVTWTRQHRKPH